MDMQTLAAARLYTQGMVASMATGIDKFEMEGTTLKIYCSNGDVLEMSFSPFKDGVQITEMKVDEHNNLVITLDDGNVYNAGELPTSPGKIYTHEQNTESDEWIIQHNLGNQYPVVIVLDDEDSQILGDIEYYSLNLLKIRFGIPLKGKAIIKNGG